LLFSPCAAAALYRRDALVEAGGFDERFFCYFEDVDLGFRLRLLGHQGKQVDNAVVRHMGSAITGRLSEFTLYHIQRNLVWTYVKNMPTGLLLLYLPQHLLLNLAGLVALWRRGKGQVVLRAKWDALKGLPAVLVQRREIQRRRVVGSRRLLEVMMRGIAAPYQRDKPARP
jgi:GT2 family glycosyltransferase